MTLEEYFGDWLKVIDKVGLFNVVNQIKQLYQSKECTPAYKDIFKVFNVTPFNKLCQIWLLYDPYPQRNVATGIALGNKSTTTSLSPSLNIVKEAVINLEIPHNCINFDPTLESWCKQGVLLLNTALTTEVGKTGCHTAIWRWFISSLLKNIALLNPGLIYILWGQNAKSFKGVIDKHGIILEMNHPAWYAREHKKISPEFFVMLNNINEREFDRKIKFYTELN